MLLFTETMRTVNRNTYVFAAITAIIMIAVLSGFILGSISTTSTYSTTTTTTISATMTTTITITTATTNPYPAVGETAITLISEYRKFNATSPTITVKAGQPVTFIIVNKDDVIHNFQIQDVAGVNLGQIAPGETKTVTVILDTRTYNYICLIHATQMTGVIQVVQ